MGLSSAEANWRASEWRLGTGRAGMTVKNSRVNEVKYSTMRKARRAIRERQIVCFRVRAADRRRRMFRIFTAY